MGARRRAGGREGEGARGAGDALPPVLARGELGAGEHLRGRAQKRGGAGEGWRVRLAASGRAPWSACAAGPRTCRMGPSSMALVVKMRASEPLLMMLAI